MGNIGYGLGLSEPCMVAGIVSEGVAQVIDELGNPWLIFELRGNDNVRKVCPPIECGCAAKNVERIT